MVNTNTTMLKIITISGRPSLCIEAPVLLVKRIALTSSLKVTRRGRIVAIPIFHASILGLDESQTASG